MQIDFYFSAKLFLLFYIWSLITFCVLFILKSKKVYFNLKEFEKICVHGKKKVIKNLKDFILSVFPLFFQGYVFCQWVKTGFNLTRKTLK